jgi:DNA-binding XRE family transcriptional regulator
VDTPLKNAECIPWEYIPHHATLFTFMRHRPKHVQPLSGPEKAFGDAFRSARTSQKISQETVAQEADCDRTTISLIERGLVSPKLATITKMCRAINTRPSAVMRKMEESRFYTT